MIYYVALLHITLFHIAQLKLDINLLTIPNLYLKIRQNSAKMLLKEALLMASLKISIL